MPSNINFDQLYSLSPGSITTISTGTVSNTFDEPMITPSPKPVPLTLDTSIRDGLRIAGASNATLATKGDVGIELEAEGTLGNMPTNPWWKVEPDGSLRNGGMEYILKKPIPIQDVKTAMEFFEEFSKEFKFAESPRTSCHVHVNVQPFTFKEVYTVIGAYWLFEDILVEYCGASRVSNLFCLRATDSSEIVHNVVKSIKQTLKYSGHMFVMDFTNDFHKYAALNLASLQRFGSIEFRSMRGIYTKKEVNQWTRMLHTFVQNARKIGSPVRMFQLFKDASLKELVDVMFGEYAEIITSQTGWRDSIKKNSHFLAQLSWMTNQADKGEFVREERPLAVKKAWSLSPATYTVPMSVSPKYSTFLHDAAQDLNPSGEEVYTGVVITFNNELHSDAY